MQWNMEEAVAYYKKQGAPGDQTVLTALLREAQAEHGGSIPAWLVGAMAPLLGVKESFLLALIRRIPSLRLADTHCLEICDGKNCGRHAALAEAAEKLRSPKITVKFVPCMRMCAQGPNIRWDGTLYHNADETLLRKLTEKER